MKSGLLIAICASWVAIVVAVLPAASAHAGVGTDIVALHWHPATANEARQYTLAAAAWLEDEATPSEDWRSAISAHALALARAQEVVPWQWAPLADGQFAWLVQARDYNLAAIDHWFPEPEMNRLESLEHQPSSAGRISRLGWVAAVQAPAIWRDVGERLVTDGAEDVDGRISAFWAPIMANAEAAESVPEYWASYAAEQARRVLNILDADEARLRPLLVNEIIRAQADLAWREGHTLTAIWLVFEALVRLTRVEEPAEMAAAHAAWLAALDDADVRRLRQVDVNLPVIVALLEDAAGYLSAEQVGVIPAVTELADVYARLALFAPDISFYLDQPVREDLRRVVATCDPDPLLVGPLPREVFEQCVENLIDVLETGLASEELVGGVRGPFAPEFLRRELGLVSWQRAAYLDGHLGWMLEAPCEPPRWVNVLDWSLMVEHLVRWVSQRPVFFVSQRWQEPLAMIEGQAMTRARVHTDWIDCLTGQGSQRRDPVVRLLARQESALRQLDLLLAEANEQFYRNAVRAGADIDLDGSAGQVTGYRPEGIMVRPCPQSDVCGAAVELPVTRALLGLFPNAYLLADQIGMGELGLCYEQVRWVDRSSSPARKRDERVANYHGRLSFELVGSFERAEDADTVFRYRMTAAERRHYLFAANDPDILALECPRELVGTAIASEMPADRPGLVPNRLTYFVSAPTTPEAQLIANWDRGAEWRDWFIAGNRVDQLEAVSGEALEVVVQAQLAGLSARRERHLVAPLISPVRADESDPLALAMAQVTDVTAMLRRLVEIHYPRVIRHSDPVRSMLAGEAGLMTRDRVRSLRDAGMPVLRVPRMGLERLEMLREHWLELPVELREQGQRAPEMDYGLERLEALKRISRFDPAPSAPTEAR